MIQRLSLRFAGFASAMMHVSRQNGVTTLRTATRAPAQMTQVAPLHVLRPANPVRRCLQPSLLRQLHSTVCCSAAADKPVTDSWTNGVSRFPLTVACTLPPAPVPCHLAVADAGRGGARSGEPVVQ